MTSPSPFPRTRAASSTVRAFPQPSGLLLGVTACSRVPRLRTPPPFEMDAQAQGRAPYQGPRGQGWARRPRAPPLGLPARRPLRLPAPPAQLPGPNPGLWEGGRVQRRMGTGRPRYRWDALMSQMRLWAPASHLTNLPTAIPPWHRGAGRGARASFINLSSCSVGAKGWRLAGQGPGLL